ncbi:MAG: hypothetical protein UY63_C0019G0003 [Parcubacteria group bacterium GW2011_GWA2_51_10]|nr:MAG: hypothetical protein UY63_C0019G0003 [Parcubacteria group bacterium GW2011_GWA2_51_10]
MGIKISREEENRLRKELEKRTDAEAARIRRYLSMPDLSRTPGNPLNELVQRILAMPDFKDFDVIDVPEIMDTHIAFDLFDFPLDHPARSRSDTYYVDDEHILRTHTTVMWYYYLKDESVKRRMDKGEAVGAFSYGKVYRKDEIDNRHMNVFHQIDGWYLAPKEKEALDKEDLQKALSNIAVAAFGPQVKYRFNPDTFPYTHPSIEMEIDKGGQWLEVGGAGIVKGSVLKTFGVDPDKWNGWAFGPGLERFAMISMELPDIRLLWSNDERIKKQLVLGQKYKEVSKYPASVRDISFIVKKGFIPNNYFDLVRDIAKDLVEQVSLIDTYENDEKLGKGNVSYAYRITYRSVERTLTNDEVSALHRKIEEATRQEYQARIR